MNLELKRFLRKGESIDGLLFIDGQRHCDTAENATTALPAGNYIIVRHFCKQYNRFVPAVMNKGETSDVLQTHCEHCPKQQYMNNNKTLPLYCPQFCPGNGIHNRTDGTIQVGTRIVPGCLKLPREPYENLCERIRKIAGRRNEISLTISENYPKPINHFNL